MGWTQSLLPALGYHTQHPFTVACAKTRKLGSPTSNVTCLQSDGMSSNPFSDAIDKANNKTPMVGMAARGQTPMSTRPTDSGLDLRGAPPVPSLIEAPPTIWVPKALKLGTQWQSQQLAMGMPQPQFQPEQALQSFDSSPAAGSLAARIVPFQLLTPQQVWRALLNWSCPKCSRAAVAIAPLRQVPRHP